MLEAENILLRRFTTTGDPEAFAEIVRRHAGLVYGACLRVVQDSDKAADVVQETFLQLLRNAGNITGSVPGWLHRVATRKAIDRIRKDSVRRRQEAGFVTDRSTTVNSWEDLSPYVDEELDRLDEQTREILIQHFFEGRTTRDIAGDMRISQATISRRVESGVANLRERLRRRGIIVAVAALSGLLSRNAAQAAPAFVLKELGKMAIVGVQAAATSGAGGAAAAATTAAKAVAGGVLTGMKLKVVTAAAVAAVGAGSVVTYRHLSQPPQSTRRTPVDQTVDRPRLTRSRPITTPSQAGAERSLETVQKQQDIATAAPEAALRSGTVAQEPLEDTVGVPSPQRDVDGAPLAGATGYGYGMGSVGYAGVEQPAGDNGGADDTQEAPTGGMMYFGFVAAEEPNPGDPNNPDNDSPSPEP